MIKEAILQLLDLFDASRKVNHIVIHGREYVDKDLTRIDEYIPKRREVVVKSLLSLVSNLKQQEIERDDVVLPLRIIVSEKRVVVLSSLDVNKERETLYVAEAQVPEIKFDRFISVEEMIIQLQTCFEESINKSQLIALISKLSNDTSISLDDDGVTQKMTVTQGIKTTVQLPPLVKLTPTRTFYEVKQPEQLFLLRIDKNGLVALFDAAGGRWKHDCQIAISDFLFEEFDEEIANGKVVVG